MSREKTLAKNTIVYFVGQFGSKALRFFLLPLYTYHLTQEEFGYYDLIITISAFLIPLVTFKTKEAVYRWLLDSKTSEDKKNVIMNGIIILIKSLIFWNFIFIIFSYFIDYQFKLIIFLLINTNIIYGYLQQMARGLKRNILYAVSGLLFTILLILLNLLFIVYFNLGVQGLIISTIVANFSVIIIIFLKTKDLFGFFKYQEGKNLRMKMMRYSLPLIPSALSWWVMKLSDRFVLRYYLGMASNGVYATANKFASILLMVNTVFYLAWQESSIINYSSDDTGKYFSDMFNYLVKFELTGVIVLIAFTKPVMELILESSFSQAWEYTSFLYLGIAFWGFSSFFEGAFLGHKKTKSLFYSATLGALINLGINLVFIPKFGIQIASISTMVAFFSTWIFRIYQTKEFIQIKISKFHIILLTSISFLFIKITFIENIKYQITIMIFSILIFIYFNFSIIKDVFIFSYRKVRRN